MAGTANIRIFAALTDLGTCPPISADFTITGVDEYCYNYSELATITTAQVDMGTVAYNKITGVVIRVITGGTTAATALSVDLAAASDWTASDLLVLQGQSIFFVPVLGSGDEIYVKNLSGSTAVYETLVFGDNA